MHSSEKGEIARPSPRAKVLPVKLVAWMSGMLAALDLATAAEPPKIKDQTPVVLVHGIFSSGRDLTRMARYLEREGHPTYLLDLRPNDGAAGIDELAAQLATFVDEQLPGKRFHLVGFSMGGLVSRYYVQRLGGVDRVEHLVTLAAPHQGTVMAELNPGRGGHHMRRNSDFLKELSDDRGVFDRVKFTSFYTPLDMIIVPANSSEMPQANNVRVLAAMHPSLILEKRFLRAVATTLREGRPPASDQLQPETRQTAKLAKG